MRIQFLGAAQTVTGSCYLVETKKSSFLVDCGMFQGSKTLKEYNYGEFGFSVQDIDFTLLTHAHVDHCGLLPKLYKKGFRGKTYATEPSKQLCGVVLPDSGYIQETEVERKNRKLARTGAPLLEPIYTAQDARECLGYFVGCAFDQAIEPGEGIRAIFRPAGHILGAAILEVFIREDGKEKKLVFSGDIGNIGQAIVKDPAFVAGADFVVMESTYGDRRHIHYQDRIPLLAAAVTDTLKKGGNLVIPSFAVERTQDMVYILKKLMDDGAIPRMDIFIDSPMAVEATRIFMEHPECFDDEATAEMAGARASDLFEDKNIHYVRTMEESAAVNRIKKGAIIVSASGMCDAGRIKHHLKHNLWRPESTVLFVGYQAEGTLGRRILRGESAVRIHGEDIAVKAEIREIADFSAHADQQGLVDWLGGFDRELPKQVFLVHGEPAAMLSLRGRIEGELGLPVTLPEMGAEYDLERIKPEVIKLTRRLPANKVLAAEVNEAFDVIKKQVAAIAGKQGQDRKILERLLRKIHEVEEELAGIKDGSNK
ncbi:MAG: MBL fold metallo-hydrolase [Peptococcaceae bacterium]|jgi:metallo-beta-lactamase family protein|nr:MBL fold metallo-hydrolase [Peptococcaceae bacterium]